MTKDEFEKRYAKESNLTVNDLNQLGLQSEVCVCGEDECPGWQMVLTPLAIDVRS